LEAQRARIVDAGAFEDEAAQWKRWPEEQLAAEAALKKK
jgi:hypothetical protein